MASHEADRWWSSTMMMESLCPLMRKEWWEAVVEEKGRELCLLEGPLRLKRFPSVPFRSMKRLSLLETQLDFPPIHSLDHLMSRWFHWMRLIKHVTSLVHSHIESIHCHPLLSFDTKANLGFQNSIANRKCLQTLMLLWYNIHKGLNKTDKNFPPILQPNRHNSSMNDFKEKKNTKRIMVPL